MRPFSREFKVVSTLVGRANLPRWAKEYADEKMRKAQWCRAEAKDFRNRLIRLDLYAKAMGGLIDVRELVLFHSTGRNPYEAGGTGHASDTAGDEFSPDRVLVNSGSLEDLRATVLAAWEGV